MDDYTRLTDIEQLSVDRTSEMFRIKQSNFQRILQAFGRAPKPRPNYGRMAAGGLAGLGVGGLGTAAALNPEAASQIYGNMVDTAAGGIGQAAGSLNLTPAPSAGMIRPDTPEEMAEQARRRGLFDREQRSIAGDKAGGIFDFGMEEAAAAANQAAEDRKEQRLVAIDHAGGTADHALARATRMANTQPRPSAPAREGAQANVSDAASRAQVGLDQAIAAGRRLPDNPYAQGLLNMIRANPMQAAGATTGLGGMINPIYQGLRSDRGGAAALRAYNEAPGLLQQATPYGRRALEGAGDLVRDLYQQRPELPGYDVPQGTFMAGRK